MTEEQVFQLIQEDKEVSSLPQVLAEVIRVADSEDADVKELAAVILKDPALTARLLRLVNSSAYGHTRKISTIHQAVVTLGGRAVKALALSTSLYRMFGDEDTVIDRMRFWRHSLESAIACREIAGACGYKPSEEAFVAGLMHDLGLLTLEAVFPQQFKRLWQRTAEGQGLLQLEEAAWGTNHARVGQFLMEKWRLPAFMGNAVAGHHNDLSQPDQWPQDRLARIVFLGNILSKFDLQESPELDETAISNIDRLSQSLGISPVALADLQSKVLTLLPKESEFLDIRIGSVSELLEAANSLIYKQYFLVEKVLRDNQRMQEQIARDEMKKAALSSLKTITATLSHYINNASATILGRAQLVQLAVSQGTITDDEHIAENCMKIVVKSVKTISLILTELKNMSRFDTTPYSDETNILDIEDRLKAHIEAIDTEV